MKKQKVAKLTKTRTPASAEVPVKMTQWVGDGLEGNPGGHELRMAGTHLGRSLAP